MPHFLQKARIARSPLSKLLEDKAGFVDLKREVDAGRTGMPIYKLLGLRTTRGGGEAPFRLMCELFHKGTLEQAVTVFANVRDVRCDPALPQFESAKCAVQPLCRGSGEGLNCTRGLIGAALTNGRRVGARATYSFPHQ